MYNSKPGRRKLASSLVHPAVARSSNYSNQKNRCSKLPTFPLWKLAPQNGYLECLSFPDYTSITQKFSATRSMVWIVNGWFLHVVEKHLCTWMLGGHVEEWQIPSIQLWGGFLNHKNVVKTAWCHSFTCGSSRNVSLLHMSTHNPGTSLHVMSFTRPSPISVLQVAKRPGYKVMLSYSFCATPTLCKPQSKTYPRTWVCKLVITFGVAM